MMHLHVLSIGILTKSIDAQEEMSEGSNLSRFRLQQDLNIESLYHTSIIVIGVF
jgi:hypothetical protein